MLRNFLTTAWRNLRRRKLLSAINISGFSLALTCCLLVALFIIDEYSFDHHNEAPEKVYRIITEIEQEHGSSITTATTPPAVATTLQQEMPGIEAVTRLFPGWGNKFYIRTENKSFLEEGLLHADSNFFTVFTAKFVSGNSLTALSQPNSIVLTKTAAQKYFGSDPAMGKIVLVDDWKPCVVTAVIEDFPSTSHFTAAFIVPLSRFMDVTNNLSWNWQAFYTYARFQQLPIDLSKSLTTLLSSRSKALKHRFHSQSLPTIHLHSNLRDELGVNSDARYGYILGTIALFILAMAGINYTNLATGSASLRVKEMGIRAVSGATRLMLYQQLIIESMAVGLVASILSIFAVQLLLPFVNVITGKAIIFWQYQHIGLFLGIGAFGALIGLLSGILPARFISGLQPVTALKGAAIPGNIRATRRKVLIIVQMSLGMMLIISTIIIKHQVDFMQSVKPGFDKENILLVNDTYYLDSAQTTALKNEWKSIPGVVNVAAADGVITGNVWSRPVSRYESDEQQTIRYLSVDQDYFSTLNMKLIAGRNFSPAHPAENVTEIILNETAVRDFGYGEHAIGKRLVWRRDVQTNRPFYAEVIGVVKNFHFETMKEMIAPFAFVNVGRRKWNYAVKISGTNMDQTITSLKAAWDTHIKSRPFQYNFLDESYALRYASEKRYRLLFSWATGIAIAIACIGLFGLSSFLLYRRSKEVSIRRVLGASVSGLTVLLIKDFVQLVFLSAVIACPLAWWMMQQWLKNYAYRADVHFSVAIYAPLVLLIIVVFTVGVQAVKTIYANPANRLREQ